MSSPRSTATDVPEHPADGKPALDRVTEALVSVLRSQRYTFITEHDLSQSVSILLERVCPGVFRPEYLLGTRCRIDFFGRGIGIELKAHHGGGRLIEVVEQLGRYAASQEIETLILVCGSARIAAHIPTQLGSKPVYAVYARPALRA